MCLIDEILQVETFIFAYNNLNSKTVSRRKPFVVLNMRLQGIFLGQSSAVQLKALHCIRSMQWEMEIKQSECALSSLSSKPQP